MIGRIFLHRYEAVRLLGEGGMGRVYLARQLDLGRQVVVKVMHDSIADDPKFCERFERETLLMARLQHPNAVTLIDASLDDPEGPCIVMEYVRGINLDTLLTRNGRMTPSRVGNILGQLCEVLQAAHDLGIIHRDLKPSNLMVLNPDTPREMIKVMDFGLAKQLDAPELKKVTDTNVDFAVGTPGYICPEQVRGEEMDHRGDLYSVGVILYELLTGRLPFPGPSSMDILLAHATDLPPTFAELDLEGFIPIAIEEVVFDCLAKDPEHRPQSARDLAERFETALAHEEALVQAGGSRHDFYPDDADDGTYLEESSNGRLPDDPNALNFRFDAFMPEAIALIKLRGFVHDHGGEVLQSVPGFIRVRLSASGRNGRSTSSSLAWLTFGRRTDRVELELHFHQNDPGHESKLHVHVVFRPGSQSDLRDNTWHQRCTKVFCDVRAYMMGI